MQQVAAADRSTVVTLSGTTVDGAPWSTAADAKGKVVVVNVWGSWCGPCVDETPHLQQVWSSLSAAGKPVQVRAYADRIVVWCNGQRVGEHRRVFGRDATLYNPLHYLPILARKPGALRNGAPFREWELPPALAQVKTRLGRSHDADRQFVAILGAILTDGLDAVEAACHEALKDGPCGCDVILNILARRHDVTQPTPVEVPAALRLRIEPAADCARYDSLRRAP